MNPSVISLSFMYVNTFNSENLKKKWVIARDTYSSVISDLARVIKSAFYIQSLKNHLSCVGFEPMHTH